ncbi:DsbA family protein [Aquipuribacter sp. MA13-6]|uniref:DsbA family protein n=1 Tax=unclassified Aquipuribacter TaxID=2635084 RepID=UPI003EEA6140
MNRSTLPLPGTARERFARSAAAQQRTERRRRQLFRGALVAVLLLLVTGVVVVVNMGRAAEQAQSAPPAHLTDGGVVVGDAPVTVTVYGDFLCPACRDFEAENGEQIARWVADGTAQVDYRPVSILDRLSPDGYPTRAAAAAAAVVDVSPESYVAFHDLLYAVQPAEGAPGPTDTELADLAVQAGAAEDVRDLIEAGRFVDWVASTTDTASQDGVVGTPTVLVQGTAVDDRSAAGLRAAVEAAQ